MILEGLVTTLSADGSVNIAPMGPQVEPSMRRLLLRPFPTSKTFQNLTVHGEGVFHVTDDVLLLARAALGPVTAPTTPARGIQGAVLLGSCRAYEFRVTSMETREERMRIDAEVVNVWQLRDFFGFNRAKHAVVEAAILATRTAFLPLDEIEREFAKLRIIVEKTGGPEEHEAFAFLRNHLAEVAQRRAGGSS